MGFWPESYPEYGLAVYFCGTMYMVGRDQATKPGDMPWAKFAIGHEFKAPVPARVGYLMKYVFAFAFVVHRMAVAACPEGSGCIMESLMGIHFLKRILEVLFLHSFTGSPTEESIASLFIGGFYTLLAWIYCSSSSPAGPNDPLLNVGVGVFTVGQLGNLYHHWLMARLRRSARAAREASEAKAATQAELRQELKSQDHYKVPAGGFYEYVACPHYFFEVISFLGAAIVAQTLLTSLYVLHLACMLGGRSVATTHWYRERFGEAYPAHRKHMIPLLF
jgi:very-long-chain enoyl-CoA reductase